MSAQHHRTLLLNRTVFSYWSHVAPCTACSRLFVVLKSDAPLHLNYMSKKPDRHIQTAQSPPCVTACKCLECERFTEATHEWTIRTLWESKTFELELKLKNSVRGSVVTAAPCQVVVRNMTVTRIAGASFGSYRTIPEFLSLDTIPITPPQSDVTSDLMLQWYDDYGLASYRKNPNLTGPLWDILNTS